MYILFVWGVVILQIETVHRWVPIVQLPQLNLSNSEILGCYPPRFMVLVEA